MILRSSHLTLKPQNSIVFQVYFIVVIVANCPLCPIFGSKGGLVQNSEELQFMGLGRFTKKNKNSWGLGQCDRLEFVKKNIQNMPGRKGSKGA